MKYTDRFGNEYELSFKIMQYVNNTTAVRAICCDDYSPYATITKNIPQYSDNLLEDSAYLDTNNCGDLIKAMIDNGYITLADSYVDNGFCRYPLGTFTKKFYDEFV